MFKTYQFKTHCEGDVRSSKTTNTGITLFARIQRRNQEQNQFKCMVVD